MIVPTRPRRPGHTTHRGDHAAGDRVAAITGTRRPAPSRAPILASRHDSSGPGPGVQHRPQAGPPRRAHPWQARRPPGGGCPRSPRTRPPPRPASPASAPRRPPRCTAADPPARCCDPGTPVTSDDSHSTEGGHPTRHHPPSPPRQPNHAQPRAQPPACRHSPRPPGATAPSAFPRRHAAPAAGSLPVAGCGEPQTAAHDRGSRPGQPAPPVDRLSPPQAQRLRVPAAPRSRVCPRRAARSSGKAGGAAAPACHRDLRAWPRRLARTARRDHPRTPEAPARHRSPALAAIPPAMYLRR